MTNFTKFEEITIHCPAFVQPASTVYLLNYVIYILYIVICVYVHLEYDGIVMQVFSRFEAYAVWLFNTSLENTCIAYCILNILLEISY